MGSTIDIRSSGLFSMAVTEGPPKSSDELFPRFVRPRVFRLLWGVVGALLLALAVIVLLYLRFTGH